MSNNSFAHIINPSPYMMCSVCSHYVGDHHDKGCSINGCDCGNGFYDMVKDMRYRELRGYVESFSYDTKIAIRIGNGYHIYGIPEAEELAKFILSMVDVAKMTAIPEAKKQTCISCKENEAVEAPALIFDGLCKTCKSKWYNVTQPRRAQTQGEIK